MQVITIPPIRDAEDRIDAIGVLLSKCTETELLEIAYRALRGDYRNVSMAFDRITCEAFREVEEAHSAWAHRHDDSEPEQSPLTVSDYRTLLNRSEPA